MSRAHMRTKVWSFCRRITLVRHQHHFPSQDKVALTPSEDDKMEQLHKVPDNTSPSYDQYLLPRQPYCERTATPNFKFNM